MSISVKLPKNPFTPTFGSIPLKLAGRDRVIGDILDGLNNSPGDPNRATIFVGARGSGKTVLLAKIAEEASADGWISVNVNAAPDMLDEILIQTKDNAKEFLTPESLSHITSISAAGVGVTRNVIQSSRKTTWRSEMTSMLKEMNEKDVGLLITVDEVDVKIDELRTLITTFQHFVRERRDVALLMAGLPPKVSTLLRDDSVSFLRRAMQVHLEAIDDSDVRFSMKKTIQLAGRAIEEEALKIAVESTKGFPFMIQLIGYQMWRQHPEVNVISLEDAEEGIILAQSDIERMIFETTYLELSEKDIVFLKAMLEDKEYSLISNLAKRMNVTSKYAGMYRKRLIEQGIIVSIGHGKVAFGLPMFRDYIKHRV
ncbi:MAG: ATP-binding protein [Oscillospiraceae bacterium]|nr:ATP-binding protein [Oscillospiraceae bacterium]